VVNIVNKLRGNYQMPISVSTRHSLMIAELVSMGTPVREAIVYSLQMSKDLLESILLAVHVQTGETGEIGDDTYDIF
jgi:nitric oxide reductase NorQ protein